MKLFNHVLDVRLSSLRPWTHFRIHKYEMHRHLVWGRLSVIFGQPHLEPVAICAECGSVEIGERFAGDEGWTVCDSCGSIEQGYEYLTLQEAEARGIL